MKKFVEALSSGVARIPHWGAGVPVLSFSLPSPLLPPFPPLPFPSLPLQVDPLNTARGPGGAL